MRRVAVQAVDCGGVRARAGATGMGRPLALAGVLLCTLASAAARAQPARVLLLPTAGEPALAAERLTVERVLTAALERQAFQVLRAPAAGPDAAAGSGAAPCAAADCAHALLRELGAELAVASALWGEGQTESGRATVSVLLIDAAAERYPAEQALSAQGVEALEAAADVALLGAQGLRLLGPGPWLEVSAEPEGAVLRIDGTRVGALPYRAAVAAGTHTLALEQGGVAVWQARVDVALGTRQLARVHVALAADDASARPVVTVHGATLLPDVEPAPPDAPGPAAATARTRQAASPWNYALGSVLVVAGAALLVTPLKTLARQGDCVGDTDAAGRCSARVEAGTGTYVQLGAAAALLIGGGTVFALRPLRVDVQLTSERALLELTTTF